MIDNALFFSYEFFTFFQKPGFFLLRTACRRDTP